jgi:glycosyltransferase involved in cell wall biosynthesis
VAGAGAGAMKRRISILCHTVSGNALGRAWVFAELLAEDFEVELVVAARERAAVWAPLRGQLQGERRWFVRTWPAFHARAAALSRAHVRGDLLIAIKPRLHSYGLALAARRVRPRPLLLDIDDWELGFFSPYKDALRAPVSWLSAASNLHTRWYFTQTRRADAITVSSTDLAARFGGVWIPHARRADALRPGSARAPEPLVMFAGTPRPHKGLGDLVRAFRRVSLPAARLRIIGVNAGAEAELAPLIEGDRRIELEPPVSLAALPERLQQAWVIAIPQRAAAPSQAQLPAKLMDAMALGKAVLSTDVGDIPKWLAGGAGMVVPPNDPEAFARALQELLENPSRLDQLGQRARERFVALGSHEAVRPRLLQLVEALLAGRPAPALPLPL